VQGDLRNFDVKPIDFEWSGKVCSMQYPHFMNHVGMKEHDNFVARLYGGRLVS